MDRSLPEGTTAGHLPVCQPWSAEKPSLRQPCDRDEKVALAQEEGRWQMGQKTRALYPSRRERSVDSLHCIVGEELKVRSVSNMPEITVVGGS